MKVKVLKRFSYYSGIGSSRKLVFCGINNIVELDDKHAADSIDCGNSKEYKKDNEMQLAQPDENKMADHKKPNKMATPEKLNKVTKKRSKPKKDKS
jgi:hypothetical protein